MGRIAPSARYGELAALGESTQANLWRKIEALKTAYFSLAPEASADVARCLSNEGMAYADLADIGVDARNNLQNGIGLHRQAPVAAGNRQQLRAGILANEGIARRRLAALDDVLGNLSTLVRPVGWTITVRARPPRVC